MSLPFPPHLLPLDLGTDETSPLYFCPRFSGLGNILFLSSVYADLQLNVQQIQINPNIKQYTVQNQQISLLPILVAFWIAYQEGDSQINSELA